MSLSAWWSIWARSAERPISAISPSISRPIRYSGSCDEADLVAQPPLGRPGRVEMHLDDRREPRLGLARGGRDRERARREARQLARGRRDEYEARGAADEPDGAPVVAHEPQTRRLEPPGLSVVGAGTRAVESQ